MQQAIFLLFISGIFLVLIGLWSYKKENQQQTELEIRLDAKEHSLLEIYEGIEGLIDEIQQLYSNAIDTAERETIAVNPKDIIADTYGLEPDKNIHDPVADNMVLSDEYDSTNENENTLASSESRNDAGDDIIEISRRKADEINNLLSQGTLTDQEIASELKIGLGEVMLIKSLGKRRQ